MYRGVARLTYSANRDLYAEGLNVIVKVLNASHDEDAEASSRAASVVYDALNKMEGLRVPRVQTAGSSGRRPAVSNKLDADVIAHVREYGGRPLRYPQDWRDEQLLADMRSQVQQWLRSSLGWAVEAPTDVGFVLELSVNGVEVDLLLVPDVVTGSPLDPSWAQHAALMMAGVYDNPSYDSPAAAMHDALLREHANMAALMDFLTEQRDEARGVAKLLKTWYRVALPPPGAEASRPHVDGLALEVLVLAAYQRLLRESDRLGDQNSSLVQLELLVEALRLIDEAVTRGSVVRAEAGGRWGGCRPPSAVAADLAAGKGGPSRSSWREDDIRVLHPLDPTCNLTRPREGSPRPDWEALAGEARRLHDTVLYGDFDNLLDSLAGVPGIRDLLRA